MKRRFEFVGGTSDKFWEIWDTTPAPDALVWTVRVRYGRRGTDGKDHVKVFDTPSAASAYYYQKLAEKRNKGYHEVNEYHHEPAPTPTKKLLVAPPPEIVHQKSCDHKTITRISDTHWKCKACGSHVEFEEKQPAATFEVMETRVRRFIARPA